MAISVNDGTAKWQLIKYSEADTLGGLTASEIKSQAISGKTVQVKGVSGNYSVSWGRNSNPEFTIPLPSGFNRTQCAYNVEENSVISDDKEFRIDDTCVNQSTGKLIAKTSGNAPITNYTLTGCYLIIAAK